MSRGLHQVSFAESGIAVNKQRIIGAFIGKIGDNIIGVTPRTFYISMSCNGAGVGTGNAW